jgi:hypothetical protein
MPDFIFLKKILKHTEEVAAKSTGAVKQHMLEQADRLKAQIGIPADDQKFLDKVTKKYAKKLKTKKTKKK